MDFFQHQTQARRRTLLLALYFLLALAGVTAAVNLVTVVLVRLLLPGLASAPWLGSSPFWWVSLSTLSIMAYGSLRKAWQLRGGATALTALLSAREVDADAGDQPLRRLRNVTEEMAIASGLPVPRLFVLDSETGINAFVAGARPDQALLVVTRGALEQLSREELQGVVAHEFSHILNGDMRLNLQLMTALSGILAVGKVGEFLLQPISRRHRYQPLFFTGGVLMMTVGYAGLFFGRLIKAAISRQREHLADACAVQFTRQSEGLAGALIKIRNGGGSLLHSLYAEDISHMGFAETVSVHLRALLSSHPPLEQRLRALGPDWNARARVRARRAPALLNISVFSTMPIWVTPGPWWPVFQDPCGKPWRATKEPKPFCTRWRWGPVRCHRRWPAANAASGSSKYGSWAPACACRCWIWRCQPWRASPWRGARPSLINYWESPAREAIAICSAGPCARWPEPACCPPNDCRSRPCIGSARWRRTFRWCFPPWPGPPTVPVIPP